MVDFERCRLKRCYLNSFILSFEGTSVWANSRYLPRLPTYPSIVLDLNPLSSRYLLYRFGAKSMLVLSSGFMLQSTDSFVIRSCHPGDTVQPGHRFPGQTRGLAQKIRLSLQDKHGGCQVVKGAGSRTLSRRCSRVRIKYHAFVRLRRTLFVLLHLLLYKGK